VYAMFKIGSQLCAAIAVASMALIGAAGFGASESTAPNTYPDGSDDPDGRQKNSRAAMVFGKT
jgi:hypothetical protein